MRHVWEMMSSLSGISEPWQVLITFLNRSLDGDLCLKNLLFLYYLFCLYFIHDFVMYIDFTHVAASNTATDDVTN